MANVFEILISQDPDTAETPTLYPFFQTFYASNDDTNPSKEDIEINQNEKNFAVVLSTHFTARICIFS